MGRSLVGLSGRAGLDVGLGLSYNSLVWTKENDTLYFDTNVDNVSPGFRLGFPTIEPAYFVPGGIANDPYWAYVMVTPSGGRVEFKQSGVTKYFETTDSSYLQLEADAAPDPNIPVDDINLTLRGTDGSVLKFVWAGGAFRCSEIKDRNGNYIEIEHDELGLLRTITDTLGREIDVNYDSELFPTSISQSWKTSNGTGSATTHNWAEFEYTTIYPNTDFASGLAVAGPPNGWPVKVLHRVIYPDDSFTVFHYNDYAQVWKVENFAADDTLLNHVRTDLQSPAADQTDVPRFTETRSWVQNFNGGNETRVAFTRTPNSSYSLPGSISGTGLVIEAAMDNDPYASVTKTWIGETGWKEGLPLASEDHAKPVEGGTVALQRWSWTNWTQDDVNASEQMNPRVVETRIGDGASTKKTQIDYRHYPSTTIAEFGLVDEVRVYGSDLSTVLKKQETDYNLSSTYLDRRIIGLPSKTQTYGWNDITETLELASELTYAFDGEDFSFEANQVISPIRHDTANFGSSFVAGRGNLTSVTRHDVTSQTAAVTTKTRYDIAGSVVARLDPLNRKVRFEYTDVFNDEVNRNSFAYPTKVYDPANNFSEAKYRFDIGANVWARSPAPAEQTVGKTTLRVFDSIGRLEKETIDNSGAYTRYAYPANGVQSQVYTTIVDTNNNNTGDTADEVLSETWTDGAGRVRLSRVPHTFSGSSTATWAGTVTEYDILGRVKRQSVPTEVDANFDPTGDDQTRGWLWTHQRYDWMGRVVRKIATDGDPNALENDSDVLISYAGCGCAGGLVTTIQGEEIIEKDWNGSNPVSLGRRTQKIYEDILGRAWKTEAMQWNGTSVYVSSETAFNERDQALQVQRTDYSGQSPVTQTTTLTYDGHGRLKTRHIPQQDAQTATSYNYNADDSIQKVTDARGAATVYSYGATNGLVTEISHLVPENSEIPMPHVVNFEYDSLGNRTQMTDGLGSVTYEYDDLSRMTAEVRDFTDALSNAPNNGLFRLEYTYTLGGQLKSLKDPYGDRIDYAYDKVARLSALTGTTFGGVATYASNPAYRAWGGLKSLSYGNGTSMNVGFDARLRPVEFEMVKTGQSTPIMEKTYDYYSDGRLRKLDDAVDDRFDRVNSYDQLGRLTSAKTGLVARGGTPTGQQVFQIPYIQSYEYNGFGNTLERQNDMWGTHNFSAERTYVNNRIQNLPQTIWEYDADGRMTSNGGSPNLTYDAAGRLVVYDRQLAPAGNDEVTRFYTGDGLEAKRMRRVLREVEPEEWDWEQQPTYYYIRSTVLGGQVVSDVYETGTKKRTYVRVGGEVIAWQNGDSGGSVVFQAADPAGVSFRSAEPNGDIFDAQGSESSPAELDPLGNNIGQENPFQIISGGSSCVGCGLLDETMPLWAMGGEPRITHNGFPISHEEAAMMADNGTLVMEIVHAARGRIEIFRDVPVGGILGNLVMPSRYRLIPTETSQRGIALTDFDLMPFDTQRRRASESELATLKKTVTAAADNSILCRQYIEDLVMQVAKNAEAGPGQIVGLGLDKQFSIEELFDTVSRSRVDWDAARGGIYLSPSASTHYAFNHWWWVGNAGYAEINLSIISQTRSLESRLNEPMVGMLTIHELLHVAIRTWSRDTTDSSFALAASQLAGENAPVFNDGRPENYQASEYWGERLMQACGFPSHITGKFTNYRLYGSGGQR